MKQKNYFFKSLLLSLTMCWSLSTFSQVLILTKSKNSPLVLKIKEIIYEKMKLPESIFKEREQIGCGLKNSDKIDYDLVICAKKNGKLEFPVYKKTILKNSYKSFF